MTLTPSLRPDLQGLWVPLITPFTTAPERQVDHAALGRLVERLASEGVHGFVVCGTTGEASALSEAEQDACLRTVAAHARGLPLMMGLGGDALAPALARLEHLCHDSTLPPLAALLVCAPAYIRPGQAGAQHWFEALADASRLPLVLYDIPYRSGCELHLDTLLKLAAHPRIVGVKDCGGDLGKTLALIGDGRLQVLAGDDLQMFGALAQGAAGAIAASLHGRTVDFVALHAALRDNRLAQARTLWHGLRTWIEDCFAEPNPAPIKAWLAAVGACGPTLRPPLQAASPALQVRLRRHPLSGG